MTPNKCLCGGQLTETKPDWFECSSCNLCYSATGGVYEFRNGQWFYKGHLGSEIHDIRR